MAKKKETPQVPEPVEAEPVEAEPVAAEPVEANVQIRVDITGASVHRLKVPASHVDAALERIVRCGIQQPGGSPNKTRVYLPHQFEAVTIIR